MEKNNSAMPYIAIIAIIAIVAIVMLLSSSGKGAAPASMMIPSMMDSDTNRAGEASMSLFIQKCSLQRLDFCLGLSSVSDAQCYSNYEMGIFARECFYGYFRQTLNVG